MRMMSCVRMMSHECERVHENCNIIPLLASEVPTKDSKVSIWFSHNVGESIVVIIKGRILTDLIDKVIKETLFLSPFAFFPGGGTWNGSGEAPLPGFVNCFRFGGV